jgi:glucose-6-phosphate 1-dehydrogenase
LIKQLVIFGAAGDLTSRYLMPALGRLIATGSIPEDLVILGASREGGDTRRFRRHIAARLDEHAANLDITARESLLDRLEYRTVDVTSPEQVRAALGSGVEPVVAYLALPPFVAGTTIESLGKAGLPDGSRIVIEKPFGTDLSSAIALNEHIHQHFSEDAIFRVDHFLMQQTVINLLGLRFANRIFELMWNRENVERVEIVFDETLALEGRASYYDTAGALIDMIQNHLLQLLCLVGMEPPITMDEKDLRDHKVDLLRAVRRFAPDEAERHTVRARYTAGKIGDRAVPSYIEEEGVDPGHDTETYAEITLFIDNWRWAGVPFVLRTGKALKADRREIVIHFRPVPHLAFEPSCPPSNVLRIQLDPDRMALGVNMNGPGKPFDLEHVELVADFAPQSLPAYARLLLDVMRGDLTLSIRDDEAEESWRIVAPILDAWKANRVPLLDYAAGSAGPGGT